MGYPTDVSRQRPVLRAWVAALVFALSLVAGVAASVAAAQPAPDLSAANYETKFMEGMIDHHAMAVMTAELCLEKAIHEDLRAMCEQIIATQSADIEQMQTWLADWQGIQFEPQMSSSTERMLEKMAALSPEEFEVAFMEMMIKHHEGAIKEASKCLDKASHEELLSLCADIIAAQAAEIEQMQAWLCEWYDICNG